jgi:hypothetical protein
MSAAALALLAACSNNAAPNAANTAAPANAALAPANTAAAAPTTPSGPVTPTISGKFIVDGKPVPLTFIGAYSADPVNGKPIIHVIFSAKSQSGASSDASADAYKFKFGDSIDLMMNPDGTIFSTDVASQALKSDKNFSTPGNGASVSNFSNSGGVISGELTSGGQHSAFGDDTVDYDLTFKIAMPAPPPAN